MTPDAEVSVTSEQSDLLRYFKGISSTLSFDRFFWVHERPDRYRGYGFTVIGDDDVVFENQNGLWLGVSKSPFVTELGTTTELVQNVKIGNCESPEFKLRLDDQSRRILTTKALERSSIKYSISTEEGKSYLEANAVYKAKDAEDCLIVDYSLHDRFENANELKNDTQLMSVLTGFFANPDEEQQMQ